MCHCTHIGDSITGVGGIERLMLYRYEVIADVDDVERRGCLTTWTTAKSQRTAIGRRHRDRDATASRSVRGFVLARIALSPPTAHLCVQVLQVDLHTLDHLIANLCLLRNHDGRQGTA